MRSDDDMRGICGFCRYYPASEYDGRCCSNCESMYLASRARDEQERKEKRARRRAEEEAARVLAEQKKREFDQMAANAARKPGISFADILKK